MFIKIEKSRAIVNGNQQAGPISLILRDRIVVTQQYIQGGLLYALELIVAGRIGTTKPQKNTLDKYLKEIVPS